MGEAFLEGVLGASSLLLGALMGLVWPPSRMVSAAFMAFGSGTLLAAIAFDITLETVKQGGFLALWIGFAFGGGLFVSINSYLEKRGGFLRHPASQRRYLFRRRQEATSALLKQVASIEVLRSLPPSDAQSLLPHLTPVTVEPDTTLCEEGTIGDALYFIADGEATVLKGEQQVATLGKGEVFGEMAILTDEPRSATVVARTPMMLYQLRKGTVEVALTRSPHLAGTLSRILARRLRDTTTSQAVAEHHLARWQQRVLDSVELDLPPPEEQAMVRQFVSPVTPLAILAGTLIDNIPESAVIGMTSSHESVGHSFLLAVFISNFPEALSSAMGMRQAGTRPIQILGLWLGVVLISGGCAVVGSTLQPDTAQWIVNFTRSTAGGAILSMLASTMMPQAYELGGAWVVFATIFGFLVGIMTGLPTLV